jgi:plastocyanin
MATTLVLAALLISMRVAAAAPKPEPKTYSVRIADFAFQPATLEVSRGDTVIWTNEDLVPHTVTAKNAFDSKELGKGQSWTFVAGKSGVFPYICRYHPTMKAQLTVK